MSPNKRLQCDAASRALEASVMGTRMSRSFCQFGLRLLLVFSLIGVVGCSRQGAYENEPTLQERVVIPADSEAYLENALSVFAEEHGYTIRIARVHHTELQFSISLERCDSLILGVNPFELDTYRFGIYPAKGLPPQDAKALQPIMLALVEHIDRGSSNDP